MTQPATSRVRFRVLGFCVALASITYMDRIAIANLAKFITRDLSLTDTQIARGDGGHPHRRRPAIA